MKKISSKLLVALLLVAMVSVSFLRVDVFAEEIKAVNVTLPTTIKTGTTVEQFISGISVNTDIPLPPPEIEVTKGEDEQLDNDIILEKGTTYRISIILFADGIPFMHEESMGWYLGSVSCTSNYSYNADESVIYENHDKWDIFVVKIDFTYAPPAPQSACTNEEVATVDRDLFKSEVPSKTVIASNTFGANSFFDLKVHAADDRTKANQKLLVQARIGPNAKILITENIYPGRDLSLSENGSLQTLTWNNLPKNQAGPVYAVVYNQTDKAYVISGTLDANGTATFTGFILRPASTITIFR